MSKRNGTFKKVSKSYGYTRVDNQIFKNSNLSLKAKGLLTLMLSLPDNWTFSERGLVQLSKDGRSSVRTTLQELEENGYLERKTIRNETGQFSHTQYTVFEEPRSDTPRSENPTSDIEPNKQSNNKQSNNKQSIDIKNKQKEWFNSFWEAYPKKVSVGQAEKTFIKKVVDEETLHSILKDLNKRQYFIDWTKDKGKWIPHASTYLNAEGWLDEYDVNQVESSSNEFLDMLKRGEFD